MWDPSGRSERERSEWTSQGEKMVSDSPSLVSGVARTAAATEVLEILVSGESETRAFQHRILKLISRPNPLRELLLSPI